MFSDLQKRDVSTAAPTDTEARAERRLRLWLMALSPNTAAAYSVDLKLFESYVAANEWSGAAAASRPFCWFVGLTQPDALEVVERWQMRMMAAGLSSATINRRTTAINAALRHLAKAGIGPGKLDIDQVRHECRREVIAPSADSVARVVAALSASSVPADIRDVAVVLLAAQRGLRRSEIASLDVDDVDLTARTVRLKRKGHREKMASPIAGPSCDALGRWLAIRHEHAAGEEMGLLVALGNRGRGRRLSGQSIYDIVRFRGGWHPHALRHSAIEEVLLASGNNLAMAQAIAGHADPSTTLTYIGKAERRRIEKEAVELLARAFRLADVGDEQG